ncbi:hypothetical protein D9C73_002454 [Collichthys lucidus]|uniref:Uncharacterized protein n=1 Tax=Collichthys lucidus TaxID=240159 RepID=A0A4V6AMF7_COLLU|nr:hypothetical protein D9C73_002454 [Collichthys lucidus]
MQNCSSSNNHMRLVTKVAGFNDQASISPPYLHPRSMYLPIFGLAVSRRSQDCQDVDCRSHHTELHTGSSETCG